MNAVGCAGCRGMTAVGAEAPKLTELQKADPAVARALNHNVAGGALVGAGLLGLLMGSKAKNKTTTYLSGASLVGGLILTYMSRQPAKAVTA